MKKLRASNTLEIMGRVGSPPKPHGLGATKIVVMKIGVEEFFCRQGDSKLVQETQWVDVRLSGEFAERALREIKPGDEVAIDGRITQIQVPDVNGNKRPELGIHGRSFEVISKAPAPKMAGRPKSTKVPPAPEDPARAVDGQLPSPILEPDYTGNPVLAELDRARTALATGKLAAFMLDNLPSREVGTLLEAAAYTEDRKATELLLNNDARPTPRALAYMMSEPDLLKMAIDMQHDSGRKAMTPVELDQAIGHGISISNAAPMSVAICVASGATLAPFSDEQIRGHLRQWTGQTQGIIDLIGGLELQAVAKRAAGVNRPDISERIEERAAAQIQEMPKPKSRAELMAEIEAKMNGVNADAETGHESEACNTDDEGMRL